MPLSILSQFDFNFRTIRFNHFDLESYDIIWSYFCSLCCFLFIANNWLRVRFELDSYVRLVKLFLKMFYTQGCFVRKKAGKVSGYFYIIIIESAKRWAIMMMVHHHHQCWSWRFAYHHREQGHTWLPTRPSLGDGFRWFYLRKAFNEFGQLWFFRWLQSLLSQGLLQRQQQIGMFDTCQSGVRSRYHLRFLARFFNMWQRALFVLFVKAEWSVLNGLYFSMRWSFVYFGAIVLAVFFSLRYLNLVTF